MTYAQQVAVEDLTVTGYINSTDMEFINGLIKSRKLVVLNLNEANLVSEDGGDNLLWNNFFNFGRKKTLQKVILPKTLSGWMYSASNCNVESSIDSLVIN